MRKLAQFSVRYPTTIIMVILAICLLGYIAFQRLGMDLLPRLNNPRLYVSLEAEERPPEEMEEQFVSPLEATVARGQKVTGVSSISRVGRALITVEYEWNTDMDEVYLELQKAVTDFSQGKDLEEISVSQLDPSAQPIVTAVLWHEDLDDLDRLRQTAENNIRNDLVRLPGVAAVELVGERTREIEIRTDSYTLEAYGLTLDQLASDIQSSNQNISGGSIIEMGLRYTIRGVGELESLEDLKNLIVDYKSDETGETTERTPITLRDVAEVGYMISEPKNIVHYNGRRCIALEIFKEARFNTTQASEHIHSQIESLQRALPGYELRIIQDQAGFIRSAVREVEQTGLIGIFLAVLILFIFLRRIGVTAVISIAIPISIVATFNLMYFNKLTLNIMTLGGLALGAGMLVDNAIVVVENIFRHLEEGLGLKEAAVRGTGEVGGAITSATLTTIIVFLPIVYLQGIAGELFKEQAWTVAFALISSLFVALSVIPMLCSRILKVPKGKQAGPSLQFPFYSRFLSGVLKKRWLVVALAFLLVVSAVFLASRMGSEFLPQADRNDLEISLLLPEGSNLERTESAVRSLESLLEENHGESLQFIFSRVGPVGTALTESEVLAGENSAMLLIGVRPDSIDLDFLQEWLKNQLTDIPGLRAQIMRAQTALQVTLGTVEAPLVVEVRGKDMDTLKSLSDQVMAILDQQKGLTAVETSFQEGRPEVEVVIDRNSATSYGLTPYSIGAQLSSLLSGQELGEYEDEGEYINIMLRSPEPTLKELEGLLLDASGGQKLRLDDVAILRRSVSPREILRNNQVRTAEVTGQLSGEEAFDKIVARVEKALAGISLPQDYSFAVTGEEKLRRESFSSLWFALLLAVILVYMVMASQFESLRHPFVILLTIPLAMVGAVGLLIVLGLPLNIMSFIGMIMLAGIAVNDSIILVDLINQQRRGGMDMEAAIIKAGQLRIRPIFMTSATTILALFPLTLGIGEGAALRAPLAVAVIGGLVTSTLLTLVVIPSVYRILGGHMKMRAENV
jgi:HAE1 family hydrophobic/amphiphilic exporter-1